MWRRNGMLIQLSHDANSLICGLTFSIQQTDFAMLWMMKGVLFVTCNRKLNNWASPYRYRGGYIQGWVYQRTWDTHPPWCWHLAVATKTCTVSKQAVRILLECFLVLYTLRKGFWTNSLWIFVYRFKNHLASPMPGEWLSVQNRLYFNIRDKCKRKQLNSKGWLLWKLSNRN